jgi:hypothetical protein
VVVTGAIFCGDGLEGEEAGVCARAHVGIARETSAINPSGIQRRREAGTKTGCGSTHEGSL